MIDARHSLIDLIESTVGSPKLGCEIGVWHGGTSRRLLEHFGELMLLMVDPYLPYEAGGRRQCSQLGRTEEGMREALLKALNNTGPFACRRVLLVTDSATASKLIRDGSLDFVYLDADHRYPCVKLDLACWHPKVRPGGLFCGDDYDGTLDGHGRWGVKRAVDEFAAAEGSEVHITGERNQKWYVIKKKRCGVEYVF